MRSERTLATSLSNFSLTRRLDADSLNRPNRGTSYKCLSSRHSGTKSFPSQKPLRTLKAVVVRHCIFFLPFKLITAGPDFWFSGISIHSLQMLIRNLEPAIQRSRIWRAEEANNSTVSQSVAVVIPGDADEHSSVIFRIGRKDGFRLRTCLNLERSTVWQS